MRAETLERSDGGVVVTRANVSARRRAQLEIEQQRRELSHLARVNVLGQLSGAFAHELRQPLSSILSNAEAARHLLQRQPLDLHELSTILLDIATEDRRAAQVIDGLRDMLKRGETHVQPLDTAALVREVLALANAELLTRRVTATAVVDAHLPPVLADRVQMQQVLLNLILNACEAMSSTPSGDRTLLLTAAASGERCAFFRSGSADGDSSPADQATVRAVRDDEAGRAWPRPLDRAFDRRCAWRTRSGRRTIPGEAQLSTAYSHQQGRLTVGRRPPRHSWPRRARERRRSSATDTDSSDAQR